MLFDDFLYKYIVLVEKEYDKSSITVSIYPDLSERLQRLFELIGAMIFSYCHVEGAYVDDISNSSYFVETLDPLFAFATLSTKVEDLKVQFFILEAMLRDCCGDHLKTNQLTIISLLFIVILRFSS